MKHDFVPLDLVRDAVRLGDRCDDQAGLLDLSGVSALSSDESALPVASYLRFCMSNIARHEDENQGLSPIVAATGHFRLASQLAMSKNRLDLAVSAISEFYAITRSDLAISSERVRGEFAVTVESDGVSSDAAMLLEDLYLQALFQYCCWFVDVDLLPNRVSLRRAAYPLEERSSGFYPAPTNYGSHSTRLYFPLEAAVCARRQTVDPLFAVQMVERHVTRVAEGRFARSDLKPPRLVVELGRMLHEGPATPAAVAQKLGMSQATLRRRLRSYGTSFSSISDRVRRDKALEMLVTDGRSIEQTAFALGFSEASSFVRAFIRWTGHSPSEFRKMVSRGIEPIL